MESDADLAVIVEAPSTRPLGRDESATKIPSPSKILVAVHGIGNQSEYATIQSVAFALCRFHGEPASIPLGRFHPDQDQPGTYVYPLDPERRGFGKSVGFAEIYWADIPREVVEKKYVIEDAQRWARTLLERIRARHAQAQVSGCAVTLTAADFDMLETVILEIIRSVDVIDRLCFLAKQAGLFRFELKTLLNDFLGDVQVVTEFSNVRRKLLNQFKEKMEGIHKSFPEAELHVVAHSEGTVVAFLGLLESLTAEPRPGWVGRVRGFMTIGSPLNKHVICWPELFQRFEEDAERRSRAPELTDQIVWHNYYDRADPIAFRLDRTREWIAKHGWNRAFSFPKEQDHEFARYPLPGKAHNDYWDDDRVFGHFLEKVVLRLPDDQVKYDDKAVRKNGRFSGLTSFAPYIIPFLLMFLGCYIFYMGVHTTLKPQYPLKHSEIFKDILVITCLLGSITVVARVARLCRKRLLHLGAAALFIGSMALYAWQASPHLRHALGGPSSALDYRPMSGLPIDWPTFALLGAASLLCLVNYLVCSIWPRAGMKLLLTSGPVLVCGLVSYYIWNENENLVGSIWPVILAAAAFSYLWWLAAIVFDLVFVWRRYIRQSVALEKLEGMIPPR